MSEMRRRTPPPSSETQAPLTPENIRRTEENRLRAKSLRIQNGNLQKAHTPNTRVSRNSEGYPATTGQKRTFSAMARDLPTSNRDARTATSQDQTAKSEIPSAAGVQDTSIRAARKFQKYVEYDFSKMTDTKGGFMTLEDDPFNRALHVPENEGKPANMTLREWEQQQLQRRLREQRSGPYEPGLSVLHARSSAPKCRECGSLEIDWQWDEVLKCRVCYSCKDKFPEKYSLLTKTEAKDDYLLTDPELKDETLLPHIEKPNPHKSTWNNMMLYVRYQLEEYAFSEQKWGSAEALDAEFERRQKETKEKKEKKFRNKLNELKKRTRVDAYKRAQGGGGGKFGDVIGNGRHEHEWGRAVEDPSSGMTKKSCVECGMEVEELEI